MSDDYPPTDGLLASEAPGDNAPALSVSELSFALKRTVEGAFDHVRVRGEISGFKRHGSGHCYFTLKDDAACIDAVIWRGQAGQLRFAPEDGIEVIATGRLTTYPARSRYQIGTRPPPKSSLLMRTRCVPRFSSDCCWRSA